MSNRGDVVGNGPRIIFVPAIDLTAADGGPGASRGWRPSSRDNAPRFGWRLIGANNRELGRSASTYPGLTEARIRAGVVAERADELIDHFDNDPNNGSWGWRASLDGVVVSVSGRGYQRQRECAYNFGQFVAGLSNGVVDLSSAGPLRVRVHRHLSGPTYRGVDQSPPFEPAAPQ